MKSTSASDERRRLTAAGAWVVCPDLRSTGETHFNEQGGYNGFRDFDVGVAALKLGETLAGYWVRDCLVAMAAAQQAAGGRLKVTIQGEGEMGLVALLVAAPQGRRRRRGGPRLAGVVLLGGRLRPSLRLL